MTQIPTWSGGPVSSTNRRAAPGTTIGGRYALRAAVGHGGMGTVWRAADTLLHRDVAVKEVVLPPGLAPSDQDAMYERTLREARAAAALQHPAVVQVYDVVTEDSRPWIVMELLDARSLADMVVEDGPVAPRAVAKIGIALLGALEVAHANGVLHRDVKPANVLICTDGRCVLTDFGVARMPTDVQLTTPGMVLGSPHFISPERAMGKEFGPPSDLFSLGVTLYTAVEGRPPFDKGDPIETMYAVVEDQPPPPARAGVLTEVLFGLLEKDPARRLDVTTAREALRTLLAGPLASRAPAHLPTDPYAVVPAQRSPLPHPPGPPRTGQIGGRAMLAPNESLTDRIAQLRQNGHPSPAPAPRPAAALDATNPGISPTPPGPVGAPTGAVATPAGPAIPQQWGPPTAPRPPAGWQPPPAGRPPAPAGRGGLGRAVTGVRQSGSALVATVRGWPPKIQIATAGGLAVVVLLAALLLVSGSDPGAAPVAQSTAAPTATTGPSFPTQVYADRGIALNIPQSWKKTGPKGAVYVDFTDPDNSARRVRILVENSGAEPLAFLKAAGNRLDKVSKSCADPYAEVGLREVQLAGKPAAELEYTCGEGDDMRHGIWRAVAADGKMYSFYLTTPAVLFADSKKYFDEAARSFQFTAD